MSLILLTFEKFTGFHLSQSCVNAYKQGLFNLKTTVKLSTIESRYPYGRPPALRPCQSRHDAPRWRKPLFTFTRLNLSDKQALDMKQIWLWGTFEVMTLRKKLQTWKKTQAGRHNPFEFLRENYHKQWRHCRVYSKNPFSSSRYTHSEIYPVIFIHVRIN